MNLKEVEFVTSKISTMDLDRKEIVLNHLKMFRHKQAIIQIREALRSPAYY